MKKNKREKRKRRERERKKEKIIWRRCCITHCRFTLHNDYNKIILTMIIFILFGAFYFYYHIFMYIFITVTKPCPIVQTKRMMKMYDFDDTQETK